MSFKAESTISMIMDPAAGVLFSGSTPSFDVILNFVFETRRIQFLTIFREPTPHDFGSQTTYLMLPHDKLNLPARNVNETKQGRERSQPLYLVQIR